MPKSPILEIEHNINEILSFSEVHLFIVYAISQW